MIDDAEGRLAALVQRQRARLARFFGQHAPDKSEVPDLVQDVFLKLTKTEMPEAFENEASYVISVARSVLTDHHRRRRVRYAGEHGEMVDDIVDMGPPIDHVLDNRAMAQRVRAALLDLPERTRDVFALKTLQGMRMADVADALNVSLSTAEKHHARALAHLAARLIDYRR